MKGEAKGLWEEVEGEAMVEDTGVFVCRLPPREQGGISRE